MAQQFGKLPPQDVSVEEAVLGAILLEKHAFDETADILFPEIFYKDTHKIIYEGCKNLKSRNEPIDILTICNELRRTNELDLVGGAYAITILTNRVATASNIKSHARIIAEKYLQRAIITVCSTAIKNAYEDSVDVFELFNKTDADLQEAKERVVGKQSTMEWHEQLHETVDVIEKLKNADLKVSGIPTGSHKIDSITGGWQKTDLIYLCGRPGAGKSTRAINFIKAACLYKYNVCMFSLEMGYRQITRKFINEESEIYGNKLITGDISDFDLQKLHTAKDKLTLLPFYLNDKGSINTSYLKSVLKQRKKKHGVDMVVIDYIQLMKPNEVKKGQSRDGELGSISMALKSIAKEFDIPVIALAQLSRKCEERIDKRPILSDLRESGSLENDADMVIGLYRPSYYYTWDKDKDYSKDIESGMTEEQYKRVSELHILKHRNGQADRFIKESFFGEFSRFVPEGNEQPRKIDGNPNLYIEPTKENSDNAPF